MQKSPHLISIKDLIKQDIETIFDITTNLKHNKIVNKSLKNHLVINLFFEHSTRTLNSFTTAAYKLGAKVISVNINQSALNKGESIIDTINTINEMSASFVNIRTARSDFYRHIVNDNLKTHIINCGSGAKDHPSQALIDAYTIKEHLGKIKDLNILICGDILHSRVARSNIELLSILGANITLCGPKTLLPKQEYLNKIKVTYNLPEALNNCDVVMLLRLQQERLTKALIPSLKEYYKYYSLNYNNAMNKKFIILHPGPVNRNVEISDTIVDHCPNSFILNQVNNGIYIRQAIYKYLANIPLKNL